MATQLPLVHSVQVYDHELDLITRLCAIVSTGLRLGDAVLIVATEEHRNELLNELEKADIDVRAALREGYYVMRDAADTLSTFMRNGSPDPELFASGVGVLLADLRARAKSRNRGLTVFGEMVAVLWEDGQKEAALRLEDIWNAALRDSTFHLHCAYPRAVFAQENDLRSVCDVHSYVLQ
jgi:KaiC/GvpD/RAD55 family RecA-like ATPase